MSDTSTTTPAEQAKALAAAAATQDPISTVGGAELAGAQLGRDEIGGSEATGDLYANHGTDAIIDGQGKRDGVPPITRDETGAIVEDTDAITAEAEAEAEEGEELDGAEEQSIDEALAAEHEPGGAAGLDTEASTANLTGDVVDGEPAATAEQDADADAEPAEEPKTDEPQAQAAPDVLPVKEIREKIAKARGPKKREELKARLRADEEAQEKPRESVLKLTEPAE
jgi:hypothetical protein